MEVLDPDSQCIYHRHSLTGETKWPSDAQVVEHGSRQWIVRDSCGQSIADARRQASTVWEELKDPLTGRHYYYSNANQASQASVG